MMTRRWARDERAMKPPGIAQRQRTPAETTAVY